MNESLMGIFDNPNRDRDEVLSPSLKPSQRRLYEVKMPYWYVIKHKEPIDEIPFCKMKYDSVVGAQFIEDTEVSSLII